MADPIQKAVIWAMTTINFTAIKNAILPVLGLILLSKIIYSLASDLLLYFIHESTLPRYLSSASNTTSTSPSWALITGASDGIGRGCAEELLSRGFNVILHGRNASKLDGVKRDLLALFPKRQIRTAILDATTASSAAIDGLVSGLRADGIHVRVLVNNVGGMGCVSRTWAGVAERGAEEVEAVVRLNALFASQLTRAMVPGLVERGEAALVVNIGSIVGTVPSPYLATYAGAKAYLGAWSRGLRAELMCEKRDIEVVHVLVGQVRAQHDRGEPTLFAPSSRRMGKAIFDTVGSGRGEVTAYWPHALQMAFINSIPESLLNVVMIRVAQQKKGEEEKGIKSE